MNRREQLLAILIEECNELAKEATKALRFGPLDRKTMDPDKINNDPDEPTNVQKMEKEFNDLLAVVDMLREDSSVFRFAVIDVWQTEKKAKVERYLEYSKKVGAMQ